MTDQGWLAVGLLAAAGAAWWLSQNPQVVNRTLNVNREVERESARQEDSSGDDSSSGSTTTGDAPTDFNDPSFDQVQVESAETTIDAIETGNISPVSTDTGVTLDDPSGYIGHTGL